MFTPLVHVPDDLSEILCYLLILITPCVSGPVRINSIIVLVSSIITRLLLSLCHSLCYNCCAGGELGTKATCVYCDLHHASNLQKLGDSGTHLTCSIDVYYSSPDSIVSWPTENHSYEVHLLAYIFKLQLKTASACIVFKVHAPDNT